MDEDKQWVVNTLEVIINHYRELEEEIHRVRVEYENILKDAVNQE